MFGWLRKRRDRIVPDELWRAVLARYPFISQRSDSELQRLRQLAEGFLGSKEFHGAGGLVITDEVALSIAVQAALPVLHLDLSWYGDFVGIVVHPAEVVASRMTVDDDGVVHEWEEVIAGEAMERGPVMLSWRDVADAGVSAIEGYNVVIHEFIHKIDMRDGHADGCPPLTSIHARREWLTVMQREFESFREKVVVAERFGGEPTWLDPYGGQSIDEFFAVAGEAYFVNRDRFVTDFAGLALLFDSFFDAGQSETPDG